MDEHESLNHGKWDCKHHAVFIPKYQRTTLYVRLRQHVGEVLRKLTEQKESRIEEGHSMPSHVHMMISIPLKQAVSQRRNNAEGAQPVVPVPWKTVRETDPLQLKF